MKIIVATPVVAAEAARVVSAEVEDTLFLKMEHQLSHAKDYFIDCIQIDKDEVKKLLDSSKRICLN